MLNSLVRGVENTCSEDGMVVIGWYCSKREVSDLVSDGACMGPSPHSASFGDWLTGPLRAAGDDGHALDCPFSARAQT